MAKKNRITIEIAANGDILGICSDRPADVYLISTDRPECGIHKYSPECGIVTFGARAVDATLDPPGTAWGDHRWWRIDKASGELKTPKQLPKEERDAIDLKKKLAHIRDLLEKQNADGKLIDAMDQAIADNEMWMPPEPKF